MTRQSVEVSDKGYVTPTEVAEVLGLAPGTVTRWIRVGYLKAQRLPGPKGHYRITPSELDRIVEEMDR